MKFFNESETKAPHGNCVLLAARAHASPVDEDPDHASVLSAAESASITLDALSQPTVVHAPVHRCVAVLRGRDVLLLASVVAVRKKDQRCRKLAI